MTPEEMLLEERAFLEVLVRDQDDELSLEILFRLIDKNTEELRDLYTDLAPARSRRSFLKK